MPRAKRYNVAKSILLHVERNPRISRKQMSALFGHLTPNVSKLISDLVRVHQALEVDENDLLTLSEIGRERLASKKNYGEIYTPPGQPESKAPTARSPKSNEAETALDSLARLLKKNDEYRAVLEQIQQLIAQALRD